MALCYALAWVLVNPARRPMVQNLVHMATTAPTIPQIRLAQSLDTWVPQTTPPALTHRGHGQKAYGTETVPCSEDQEPAKTVPVVGIAIPLANKDSLTEQIPEEDSFERTERNSVESSRLTTPAQPWRRQSDWNPPLLPTQSYNTRRASALPKLEGHPSDGLSGFPSYNPPQSIIGAHPAARGLGQILSHPSSVLPNQPFDPFNRPKRQHITPYEEPEGMITQLSGFENGTFDPNPWVHATSFHEQGQHRGPPILDSRSGSNQDWSALYESLEAQRFGDHADSWSRPTTAPSTALRHRKDLVEGRGVLQSQATAGASWQEPKTHTLCTDTRFPHMSLCKDGFCNGNLHAGTTGSHGTHSLLPQRDALSRDPILSSNQDSKGVHVYPFGPPAHFRRYSETAEAHETSDAVRQTQLGQSMNPDTAVHIFPSTSKQPAQPFLPAYGHQTTEQSQYPRHVPALRNQTVDGNLFFSAIPYPQTSTNGVQFFIPVSRPQQIVPQDVSRGPSHETDSCRGIRSALLNEYKTDKGSRRWELRVC